MSSLTSALRIATSGMQASQLGLGTVAHNVTNANTPGYTRQIVQAGNTSYNGFGAGVQINQIQRVTDTFISSRVLGQVSQFDYASTRSSYLQSVEGAFSSTDANSSLDNLVSNMFASLNQLGNDPDNAALKRNVVQTLGLVTDTVNSIHQELTNTAQRANAQITEELSQTNSLLKRIHELNVEIALQTTGTSNGANVNDLMDERDRQVEELSKLFKLDIITNPGNGSLRITTESGQRLVDEASYVQFERTSGTPYQGIGFRSVQVGGNLTTYVNTLNTNLFSTGRIRSLLDIRDTTIPGIISQMDEFATTLKTDFNRVASQGTTYPPQRTLASHNTGHIPAETTDLLTELNPTLLTSTFNLSVTDSQGNVIRSTVGNGGAINFTGLGPTLSLDDIATAINNNADIGVDALALNGITGGVTASVGTAADGSRFLQLQATNSNARVVISAVNGDFPGIMGFNNILTGDGASDLAVRSALKSDPTLIPTARMRADGGVSSLSNTNVLELAKLAETKLNFDAAGGLGVQNITPGGYIGEITGSLAVTLSEAKSRQQYAETLHSQLQELKGSISGVNMNEELTLMLTYQQGFQASARLVTVVDSLLQELMNTIR